MPETIISASGRPRFPATEIAAFFGYLAYFAGHLIFAIIIVPLFILLTPFQTPRRRFMDGVFWWYVHTLSRRYLPFIRVYRVKELSGLERAMAAGPAIYMANHRSRMDGPLLLGTVRNSTAIIKGGYARNFLYSGFVKYMDFISVEPGALSSIEAAMEQAKRVIAQGRSIIVFPEGTRASTGRLLPFKDIGLRLARATNAPVVPVVLHSTLPFMAKRPGSIFLPYTFDFTIRFLEPIRLQPTDRLGDVLLEVERMVAGQLKQLDKGTMWEV
jgi:1-acyl-sn-glycerol-3-phosphate acyltransferase